MVNFNEKEFANVRLIIVHGGYTAHQDEEVACGLAWAAGARGVEIERRDPTPEELADPTVLVIDVGMQYDPALRNFDHHQRGRDEESKCAYALLAEFLGIRDFMAKAFPYFEPGIIMDCKGPRMAAKAVGADWAKVKGLVLNPAAARHHRKWAADPEERKEYAEDLGNDILTAMGAWPEYETKSRLVNVDGIKVLDVTGVPKEFKDFAETYAVLVGANAEVFNDDRGEGLGLYRVDDYPHLDFHLLEGRDDIVFAHKEGFIAKTRTKSNEEGWSQLIKAARV